jgi:hypothetical protein
MSTSSIVCIVSDEKRRRPRSRPPFHKCVIIWECTRVGVIEQGNETRTVGCHQKIDAKLTPLLVQIVRQLTRPRFSNAADCPGAIAGIFTKLLDLEIASIGQPSARMSPNPEKAENRTCRVTIPMDRSFSLTSFHRVSAMKMKCKRPGL